MLNNAVGWFEIYVEDISRAKAFYERVFEVKLQKLEAVDLDMWAFPMHAGASGASGALVKMPDFPRGGQVGANGTLVYFSSQDCALEAQRAREQGKEIIRDKFSIGPYGFVALLKDTEGNIIGIHSQQ